MAWLAEDAGADGITMHIRELSMFNWRMCGSLQKNPPEPGGFLVPEMVELHSVCLVPEHRMEVTTEGGLMWRVSVVPGGCVCI